MEKSEYIPSEHRRGSPAWRAEQAEKNTPKVEARHPLEKVTWDFYVEDPDILKEVFTMCPEDQKNQDFTVFYADRETRPELDGWMLMISADYEKQRAGSPEKKDAIVVRVPNDSYGKGAQLRVYPPKESGNANLRTLGFQNGTLMGELSDKNGLQNKSTDMFPRVAVV